ncbi:MAG: DNA translocase FtsK 4TM domain-containing protein, partial [Lachnospiraceae bacterium]|nr:DNA translocase FtsK 4TM domain-containing protein [Lachnospiraceae bacterium]
MAQNKTTKTKTKSSGRASAPASASSRKKSTSGARSSTSARSGSAKRQTRTAGAAKGNRTSSAREARAREQARLSREQREREIRLDIALIVMLIIMLFLFLSMLGFGGSVGKVLADILFGLFGIVAWCVPVYLFLFSLLLLTNSMTTRMRVRLAALMILMLTGEAIAHLQLQAAHLISLEAPFSPLEAFRFCSGNHLGGGVIGGAVSWFLYYALRMVGSAVFLTGAALIGLLLLIQRSPAGALRSWHNRRADEDTPGFAERRRIYRQRRLEELERERERELEREAEKILYREEREERRLAEPEPARTRRKRKRTPLSGRNMDLEHTRLRGAGQSRNSSGYPMLYEEGIQGAVKRDVHEIVVLPAEGDDPLTVPAQPRRSRAAAAGTVRPLSGRAPDPDGTRYQKPGQDLPVIHNGYDDLSQEDSPSAETMTGRRTERVPEGPELISPPQDTDYN